MFCESPLTPTLSREGRGRVACEHPYHARNKFVIG
jgi:hypothetical protein